jgi:hypothetical protein
MDLVIEVYQTLKNYIPQKDRQEASDTLMSLLVDMMNDDELKEFAASDAYTQRSYKEYAADIEEYDDDSEYED